MVGLEAGCAPSAPVDGQGDAADGLATGPHVQRREVGAGQLRVLEAEHVTPLLLPYVLHLAGLEQRRPQHVGGVCQLQE